MPNTPLILAHRGARKYAPENTLIAFEKAMELDVDGVEFDVLSTSDGVPVVVHDDNLRRVVGRHMHVHKLDYAELKDMDVGSHFGPYFAGAKIPTLNEVLGLLNGARRQMLINIELKKQARHPKGYLERVANIIAEYQKGTKNKVVVSSFSPFLLRRFSQLDKTIPCALLVMPQAFSFLRSAFFANILAVWGLNPHIALLNRFWMAFARSYRINVIAWTANSPSQIEKALKLGVYGIITDEPVLAKEMRGA